MEIVEGEIPLNKNRTQLMFKVSICLKKCKGFFKLLKLIEWLLYPSQPGSISNLIELIFNLGLVVGGRGTNNTIVDTVEIFTPGQTCSKILAPIPLPAIDPVLTVISGEIFLLI